MASSVSEYLNVNMLSASTVGCVTFPSCLGFIQHVIFSSFRTTSSLKLFAPLFGSSAVFVSASVASLATVTTYTHLQGASGAMIPTNGDLCLAGVIGMVSFKTLGGRFRSVLPSNLFKPGAFAREWIPARWEQYAAHYERHLMQEIGRKRGCHSCGTRIGKFIADHQPPIKLSAPGELLRFYPHCRRCATLQGNILSRTKPPRVAVRTHTTSLRLYHLFLPVPLIMTVLRSGDADAVTTTHQQQATESIVAVPSSPIVVEGSHDPVPGYVSLLTSVNEFLSQFSVIGQFHIFVQFCIAIAAIGSL